MVSLQQRVAGAVGDSVGERLGVADFAGARARKGFPDHWSFMPGEVVLYGFVMLLLFGLRGLRVFFTDARNDDLTDLSKDVLR